MRGIVATQLALKVNFSVSITVKGRGKFASRESLSYYCLLDTLFFLIEKTDANNGKSWTLLCISSNPLSFQERCQVKSELLQFMFFSIIFYLDCQYYLNPSERISSKLGLAI
ncbi:MAG TPA: hypothetical protein VIF37_03870 [Methylobacter sp.]|jgi:hypothetical protein